MNGCLSERRNGRVRSVGCDNPETAHYAPRTISYPWAVGATLAISYELSTGELHSHLSVLLILLPVRT